MSTAIPVLEVQDLGKSFGGLRVIENLSLRWPPASGSD
jgi:ABC-type branched-subunit amino acid transport system ATPase component